MWGQLFWILMDVPNNVDEIKARDIEIHECLKKKTCTSTYDQRREAYIIKYKEPLPDSSDELKKREEQK